MRNLILNVNYTFNLSAFSGKKVGTLENKIWCCQCPVSNEDYYKVQIFLTIIMPDKFQQKYFRLMSCGEHPIAVCSKVPGLCHLFLLHPCPN